MTSCGLFKELQSEDGAEDGDEGGDGPDHLPDGDCEFPYDDRCGDQDTVYRCDPESGEMLVVNCADLCGGYMNFTCLGTGTGEHGCWCTEAGKQKVLSCTDLESCLKDCVSDATGACTDQCFGRTDASTVRLYGTLVYCAHDSCHDTCLEAPESCASCIEDAIALGQHGCAFPRSVCDSDRNDEPWTPYG